MNGAYSMKIVLICHAGDDLTRYGFARWLASFSDLNGIVEIHEDNGRARQRIRAEVRRVGWLRFLFDVLPYRVYSRIAHASASYGFSKRLFLWGIYSSYGFGSWLNEYGLRFPKAYPTL